MGSLVIIGILNRRVHPCMPNDEDQVPLSMGGAANLSWAYHSQVTHPFLPWPHTSHTAGYVAATSAASRAPTRCVTRVWGGRGGAHGACSSCRVGFLTWLCVPTR